MVDEAMVAIGLGDMEAVLARLAPDVVCITDGGLQPVRRPPGGVLPDVEGQYGGDTVIWDG